MRGAGLLIGLDLAEPCPPRSLPPRSRPGFIINNPTPERIRLAPPLVLTEAQADSFLAAWPGILDAAYGGH